MKETVKFLQDFSVDTAKTEAVEVPDWAKGGVIEIPDIVAGAVTMEYINETLGDTAAKLLASADTNWNVVEVAIDSVDSLTEVLASGDDPRVVDISIFVRGLGDGWIRFVCAGTQNADTIWYMHWSD